MRYYRPEMPAEFVVRLQMGLSKEVLDMGLCRRRLQLEVREYEGSCWGRKRM